MMFYKTALVMGVGASGAAAAELLLKEGTKVIAIDSADNSGLRRKAARLRRKGASVVLKADSIPEGKFDVCIVSPGISSESAWVRTVELMGCEVLSELELGATRCRCKMLAVTGSKGKSTMVKFCADALDIAGKRVEIAGNYGPPICGVVMKKRKLDWIVVEVSSFQLERVKTFRPDVGVLLNIQPDHLDRHGGMRAYTLMKARLFGRMSGSDTGVVLEHDLKVVRKLSKGRNRWLSFGSSAKADFRYSKNKVYFSGPTGVVKTLDFSGTVFGNEILGLTAAAAVASLKVCGIPPEDVLRAARKYRPLPHRMQKVAVIKGVTFVNDSKATNLAALAAGVRMCDGPVRLIAGGLLKENSFNFVKKILVKHVIGVYLIGSCAQKLESCWGGELKCFQCGNLTRAVELAWRDSVRGEFILLSPGCASFDQFEDFEDRGRQFVKIARSLRSQEEK